MIKKTITWKNYDNEDVSKDFWFHLDAGEIAEIELSDKMGYSELLRVAQENEDPTVVGDAFRKIVLGAVGRREGELFVKDQDAVYALQYSGAYSELIVWMLNNPVEAAAFINGMLPSAAQDQLAKDAIVEKMRAKTEEMKIQNVEVSLDSEESVFPVDPPTVVMPEPVTESPESENAVARPLAADFAAMSPEEFEAWKNAQA